MLMIYVKRGVNIFSFTLTMVIATNFLSLVTTAQTTRQKILINDEWRFLKSDSVDAIDLTYDVRPKVNDRNDNVVADTKPTERVAVASSDNVLKKWILPTANDFIKDPAKHHQRPGGSPGSNVPFIQNNFDDSKWQQIHLPHDWAINGPFYENANPEVGGGIGRLPSHGVGWYRRKLNIPAADKDKSIFLDIDGAMSYAMVWLNGNIVGGWPYGYNSFRLDITPYVKPGGNNQLVIRLDNPNNSARWYPGGGIYRNVWLAKLSPVHIAQWGTFITTTDVSASSATVNLVVDIENRSNSDQNIRVVTEVYGLNNQLKRSEKTLASYPIRDVTVPAGKKIKIENSVVIKNPMLWGPPPSQKPNLYVAVTRLYTNGKPLDE